MAGTSGTSATSEPTRPRVDVGAWGLSEAVLGWISAQFLAVAFTLGILGLGDWSFDTARRPGGNIGRAVGQLSAGDPLRDDALPLVWRMMTLAPLWIGLLAVPWLFAKALGRRRPGWSLDGEWSDVSVGAITGLLMQVPIIPIVFVVMQLIFGELEPTRQAQGFVEQLDSPVDYVVLYLFVAVGAPVVEELFYRGLVQRNLVERVGPVLGIGIASVIFGAVHASLVEFLPLSVVGAVLGVLAWRTGRLLPAIIAHMVFNATALTMALATTASV